MASAPRYALSFPHPLIRPQVLADIRAVAHRLLAPQIARAFDLSPQLFFQAIFDLESPRLFHGRVVLLGDAAFVARPHVGMGVAKAALDAQYLTDAIAAADHDLEAALPRYDAARRAFGTREVGKQISEIPELDAAA